MEKHLKYRVLLLMLLVFAGHINLNAQLKFKVNGNWSYTVPANDVTEAGSDFTGTYTSLESQVNIKVKYKGYEVQGYSWRVSVKKLDSFWDNTASIYVRRTSDGVPIKAGRPTTITGGTVFQQITDVDQYFFEGYRGSKFIDIQYQLQGVSVVMPAQSYSTTIIYTLTAF